MDDLTLETLQEAVETNLINDGFLMPVVFLCTDTGAQLIDASEFMESDEKKNLLVEATVQLAKESSAYKIVMVSEGWMYTADKDAYTDAAIAAMAQDGSYREILERSEVYQIIEITGEDVRSICRQYTREENQIVLGEILPMHGGELMRFKPMQECLRGIN
jgi:hypothetical protein